MMWNDEAKDVIASEARRRWVEDFSLPEPTFSGPDWTLERHMMWCKLIAQSANELGYSRNWK